jgi:L-threonylcarbamoyladenylate synthase
MLSEITIANQFLNKGKIILYPTDTVWGLGCDATDTKSVAKIYQLKNRVESKSLIVLVSSIHMLKKYVPVPKKAIEILQNTNKPTTIIYQNPKGFAKNTIASDHTIAIRITKDDFCRKLIKRFGKPIVSTSANISGEDTPKSFSEISSTILDSVDYIVNLQQNIVNSKSSTIVKIVGDTIQVLRA